MLEDETDATFTRAAVAYVLAVEVNRTGIGALQAGDNAKQRRLSRTRRA